MSPIPDECPWRNLPTRLRSDIPRRRRAPQFAVSSPVDADVRKVVAIHLPGPAQSSSSTSCLQSQITSLESHSDGQKVRSEAKKRSEQGSEVDDKNAPDAKRIRRDGVSETGSSLESVSETTTAAVRIAESSEEEDSEEMQLSDSSSDWLFWSSEGDDAAVTESSQEDDAAPSEMYALFLQFTRQFSLHNKTAASVKIGAPAAGSQDKSHEKLKARLFEEEQDEDSYRKLRSREKRAMEVGGVFNYTKDSHKHSHLILDQRHVMVGWMIERFKATDMQLETLFLGVSIMDRILLRGYFQSVRHLQLLGIASITLATRIEENQPYNCVLRTNYIVEKNFYSRNEVVAMEWLVQDILDFKCFVPTIHNFIWFYLKAAKADDIVDELARYLAVVILLDHERLSFKASTLAASIVILACLAAGHDESSHVVIETHVRTRNDDLPECLKSLEWLIKHAGIA